MAKPTTSTSSTTTTSTSSSTSTSTSSTTTTTIRWAGATMSTPGVPPDATSRPSGPKCPAGSHVEAWDFKTKTYVCSSTTVASNARDVASVVPRPFDRYAIVFGVILGICALIALVVALVRQWWPQFAPPTMTPGASMHPPTIHQQEMVLPPGFFNRYPPVVTPSKVGTMSPLQPSTPPVEPSIHPRKRRIEL